jgi:hypothetical protein
MVTVSCETVRFDGEGRFRCHRCGNESLFAGDCAIVLLVLPHNVVLQDARTNATMHNCWHPTDVPELI